jgi:hypothetical protein
MTYDHTAASLEASYEFYFGKREMNSYTVTATNKYFWQKLGVAARSREVAARKFDAFLRSRSSQNEEKYEWSEGGKLCPDERCERADYRYRFDEDRVEPADFVAAVVVTMINSGGNG